ncbi:MAG: DHH family phosphoesterase [Euryarchaeota archaeon]|nr:DHH family phosphoesterase [Euryarchaeota archaeon]
MLERLEPLVRRAVEAVRGHSHVRVVAHHDADGITGAGVVCHALSRASIPFQASIVSRLDGALVEELQGEELVLFCDMGSAQSGVLSGLRTDLVVLDHHPIVGEPVGVLVNPWRVGIDGTYDLSTSGVAYAFARQMADGKRGDNTDLAGLALAGAICDKQWAQGANADILREGVRSGSITTRTGLRIAADRGTTLEEAFLYSVEPYLDFSGDPAAIRGFLGSIGLRPEMELRGLDRESLRRLSSALHLKLLPHAPREVLDGLVGDVYDLNREAVVDAMTFTGLVNAAGYTGRSGLVLSLCLRDASVVEESHRLYRDYQRTLMGHLREVARGSRTLEHIRYYVSGSPNVSGAISTTVMRYLFTDRPFLAVHPLPDMVKISARGTREMVARGLDLSAALRESSQALGGMGGGHNIASGAGIPPGSEEEFLRRVDQMVGEQLSKKP